MKKIVCLCEDITYDEIVDAIKKGYTDMESLKRYVGFSTGPCQGKSCITHVIRILSMETKKNPKELKFTTPRPPIQPIFMKYLGEKHEEKK